MARRDGEPTVRVAAVIRRDRGPLVVGFVALAVALLAACSSSDVGSSPSTTTTTTMGLDMTDVVPSEAEQACLLATSVTGVGKPLGSFPFFIPTDFPHFPHQYPPNGVGSDVDLDGGIEIVVPSEPATDAAYGAWWPIGDSPPGAHLVGARFNDVSWEGEFADVVIAVTVQSRERDEAALGLVTGSGAAGDVVQGIPGELIGVHFAPNTSSELWLQEPRTDVARGDFLVTLDVENAPLRNEGGEVWPSSISLSGIEWLWQDPGADCAPA